MSLKIFVSSVSGEFEAERRALERAISKLGEIYVGMEHFGSDPRSPVAFDGSAVESSDLYVGLLGDRVGSIEAGSGMSFTELEYHAARKHGTPTLVYFKHAFHRAGEDLQQTVFKQRVQQAQLGVVFEDAYGLENQFLIDLFKQIRGPLFSKLRPQLGLIPFDALHAITMGLLPEQVRTVGQDKYIPKVYVPRPAEDQVREFVEFEERFVERSQEILATVGQIAQRYGFHSNASPPLSGAEAAVLRCHDTQGLENAAAILKRACFFDSIEADFAKLELIYRQPDAAGKRMFTELASFLRTQPYVDRSILSRLEEEEIVSEIAKRRALGQGAREELRIARSVFPSVFAETDTGPQVILANDLLKDLDRLIERCSKRCLALVDRAGRGKTNVICRIAEAASGKHAVILLSGQMEISTEYQIEWHIQRQIESAFGAAFTDWMSRADLSLEEERRWLLIVVDGVNENAALPLFIRMLQNLLPKLASRRIKLILSCRDIYWDLFLPSLRLYLFEQPIALKEFSEQEWQRAISLYFKQFQISADVGAEAAVSLRNPLLLRFFSEANQGRILGRVSDIHLRSVFTRYIERISQTIVERKGLLSPQPVFALMLRVVVCLWQYRSPAVEQSLLGLSPEDIASSESIYNLIRSENVILDEVRHPQSLAKNVRFVYDEFMEYLLAQSWFEEILAAPEEEAAIKTILQQAAEAMIEFPAAMGGVLFLDQMLQQSGRLVNRTISFLGSVRDVLLNSRQMTLLYALENIEAADVDDNLLELVDQFEVVAAVDLRPRLSQVILQLLQKNPGRLALQPLVKRMLEVTAEPERMLSDSIGAEEESLDTVFEESLLAGIPSAYSPPTSNEEMRSTRIGTILEQPHQGTADNVPLLPPARYHYTEDTKLNAISLLIASRNPLDYEIADLGIHRLGRMDLHSALFALESVDLADDAFVYKTIESHMRAVLPEYRIYCAWLLRRRYGGEASEYILKLLSDRETRVHKYTFSLFDTRKIEKELVQGILSEMRPRERIKPWVLVYFIKLLGKRASHFPLEFIQSAFGRPCADTLRAVSKEYLLPYVRLAAFRSLAAFPEYLDPTALAEAMRMDADPHIQALANTTAN